ncbi:uncharacterized protein LOC113564526 [Drosophila erecta]|uniref:uncharacterized protein LOC113564526 n=1 Tax=Drosophila erecta TaxID=7220 RepID=UPI000F05CF29|nr:uncharacterized protein LOC113564526 [Drosophila erecta]
MEFMPLVIFVIHVLYYGLVEIYEPECIWNETLVDSGGIDLRRNPILYDEEQAWRKKIRTISWILGMPYNVMQQIEYMVNNITTPRNLDGDNNEINKNNETLKNSLLHDGYIVINNRNNSENLTLMTQKFMIYNYVKYHILPNKTLNAMH